MNFTCDRCNSKVSFWETLNLKRNHITVCNTCGAKLYPIKTKSFNWGFAISFVAVVIPAEIVYIFTHNLAKMFVVAIICAIVAIFGIAFYTYKTTKFRNAFQDN